MLPMKPPELSTMDLTAPNIKVMAVLAEVVPEDSLEPMLPASTSDLNPAQEVPEVPEDTDTRTKGLH